LRGDVLRIRQQRIRGESQILGIATGIGQLDVALSGLNGLMFLAGPAGVGKTDLAIDICARVLQTQADTAVVLVELDLKKNQVFDRLICNLAQVTEQELLSESNLPAVDEKIEQGLTQFSELSRRLDVISLPSSEPLDVSRLLTRLQKFYRHCRCRRLVVVVDYLQLLSLSEQSGDPLEQDRQRAQLLSDLRDWSANSNQELSPVFLVISEVRKIDRDRDLVLEDLPGAARLQYKADSVMMLQSRSQSVTAETAPVELLVVKCRRGSKARIPLTFRFRRHSFAAPTSNSTPADTTSKPSASGGRRPRKSK